MNRAAELGTLIHAASGLQAAAMGAHNPSAARGYIGSLEGLAASAAQMGASDVARLIDSFAHQAYKHVTDLITQQEAETTTREAIVMGEVYKIDAKKEPLASKLVEMGHFSEKVKAKFESIAPTADHKVIRFSVGKKGEDVLTESTVKGSKLRDSVAIAKASGDLAGMEADIADGKIAPGSEKHKEYLELNKTFNKMVYGQDERPNQFKRDPEKNAAENKAAQATAQEKLDAGRARIKEAIGDVSGHSAAHLPPDKQREAAKKHNKRVSSLDTRERTTDSLTNMQSNEPEQASPQQQAGFTAAKSQQQATVNQANAAHRDEMNGMFNEWAGDVTPSQNKSADITLANSNAPQAQLPPATKRTTGAGTTGR